MVVPNLIVALILLADTTDPAIKDFNDRVQHYWDLHKKAESAAPPINKKKARPEAIVAHERGLAAGIRAARMNAAEGDIFTRAAQTILVATINQDLRSSA